MSPYYRIVPPEKSPPADNLAVKIRPAWADFAGKLSAGGNFSGGDPITGHRPGVRLQPVLWRHSGAPGRPMAFS